MLLAAQLGGEWGEISSILPQMGTLTATGLKSDEWVGYIGTAIFAEGAGTGDTGGIVFGEAEGGRVI